MMVDGNNKRRHMRKAEAGQGYACLLGVERLGRGVCFRSANWRVLGVFATVYGAAPRGDGL